jgi:hypothetical protein
MMFQRPIPLSFLFLTTIWLVSSPESVEKTTGFCFG